MSLYLSGCVWNACVYTCTISCRYDEDVLQEPTIYRVHEALMHYADSIKLLINEKCGDGIMSAIDFNFEIEKIKGSKGEDRVKLVMDGKFLPFTEQVKEQK